jgi:hypothetical protein
MGTDKPSAGLAARIRAAVQRKEAEAAAEVQDRKARKARLKAERTALFDELAQLGADAGLGVERVGDRVSWALGGKTVTFEARATPEEPSWIHIEAPAVDADLGAWFEPRLERWALKITQPSPMGRRDYVRTVTLTGDGLDWLVSKGLDLPLE